MKLFFSIGALSGFPARLGLWVAMALALTLALPGPAQGSTKSELSKPLVLAVIDKESKPNFDSKVGPLFKDQMSVCSWCEIKNFTPYNSEGQMQAADLAKQLELAGTQASFIFIRWNMPMADTYAPIVEALKKLTASGVVVVGSAGASSSEVTVPLSRTVLGQDPDVLIIGELAERDRLLANSYFGPEMLTALRPPKDLMGQGYSSIFFASKLATNWNKKTSGDWVSYLKSTKSKSRKLWPDLNDFFSRVNWD